MINTVRFSAAIECSTAEEASRRFLALLNHDDLDQVQRETESSMNLWQRSDRPPGRRGRQVEGVVTLEHLHEEGAPGDGHH